MLLFISQGISAQLPVDYEKREAERDAYEQYLRQHPFNNRPRMSPEEWKKKVPKRDRPDLAWEQDFLRTMDPRTKKPERDRLYNYMVQQSQLTPAGLAPGATGNAWTERGPNNIGGRTRALAWDPNTANKVWAGGVTGGLWYNNNIHSSTSSWQKVNDFWDNIAVTAIAFDPNNPDTIYVGTGEGWGTGSSIGGGIWRSTNGGSSFSLLTSTTSSGTKMSYINDLEVRDESGTSVVYAAVSRMFYNGTFHGVQGLYRSTNAGSSWTQVLPNVASTSAPYAPADLEIDAGNRLWVGTRRNSFGNGGGTILYSDNGTSWTNSYSSSTGRRVEVACAPSNQNRVYAIISARVSGSEVVDRIVFTNNRGSSWGTLQEPNDADNGIPSTDFSRGQAWYDLILRVDPNNQNTVYAGAINWFRSTNGGFSWTQISKWSNNPGMGSLNIPLVHADQHAMEFKPGSSDTVIIGTDGGVYYSGNISTTNTSNLSIPGRKAGYNTLQFYSAALHPTAGNNHMLAGSQDNGTLRLNSAGVGGGTEVRGGDGGFCFIDQTQPQYQIASYVYNSYYLSTNGGTSTFTTQLIRDLTVGAFINPADYDDNRNALFAARENTNLTRVRNVTGTFSDDTINVSGMNSRASAIRVSQHTTTSSTVFVGTRNGRLYKVTGADGSSPSTTRIDNSAFPTSTISCIEVGGSEDTLLVTMFNYGINSVWYTTNGGTNWVNKDNSSLPDMPIRWSLINPFNSKEVILATDLGVWRTSDISVASPSWSRSNNGFANVRVDMLQMRNSDSTVMASTYGRGVFTSKWAVSVTSPPNSSFVANDTTICVGDTVSFTNNTSGVVTSRNWTFTGGSPTSSTAQNPQIIYNTPGTYNVRLISSNGSGSDTLTRSSYITVSANPTVSLGAFTSVQTTTPAFALTGGSPSGGTYSGPGVSSGNFDPSVAGAGTHTITYTFTNANGCSGSATNTITVTAPTTVTLNAPSVVCLKAGSVSLTGSPSGGSFSGTGVSGSTFDPNVAGIGTHNITYTVSGQGSDTKTIRVSDITAGFGSFAPVCDNISAFTITGGTFVPPVINAGPTYYSFNGSQVTTYDPGARGPGTDTIWHVVTNTDGCIDSVSQTITVNASPTATLSTIPDQCAGNNAFTLSGNGPGPGNFFVNGNLSSTFDPGALGAGTQVVKFEYADGNNCRDSALQNVQVFAQPNVSMPALADVCANDASFALSGATPVGGTYTGSGVNAGFFNPGSVVSNNTYTITYTYTDGNNCTDSASQGILVKPIPIIRASNDTAICFGTSLQLSAGGGVNYSWTPSAGLSATNIANPVATPFINTLYYVTGTTFNGCSNTDSVNIIVNPLPNVNAGLDITVCDREAFQLNGVGAMNYSWSPSIGLNSSSIANPTGVLSNTTSYTLTGTSMAGCQSTDTVIVQVNPKPVVNAGVDTSLCEGELYTLNGSGASSYLWSPNMGLSSPSVANPNYIVNGNMTYTLVGSNSFGCSDTDVVTITGKPLPNVSINPISDRCLNDASFALSQGSPGGGTYSGPGILAGLQFRPASAGVGTHNIIYTITGANGCINSANTNLVVYANPQLSISGLATVYCENDPAANLSLSPAGGNLSGSGIVANSFVPTNAGIGSHTVNYSYTDSNNCSASISQQVRVSEVFPVSDITGFKRVLKNRQYTYSVDPVNGASYQWQVTNGTLVAQANNVATVQWGTIRDGRLTVTQTTLDGCSDSTIAFILVGTVGEEEIEDSDLLRIFPNPATRDLHIESQFEVVKLEILSSEGKMVYSNSLDSKGQNITINVESWSRGIYLVRSTANEHTTIRKIILN